MQSWTLSDLLSCTGQLLVQTHSPTGGNIGLHSLRRCFQLPTSLQSASSPTQYRQLPVLSLRFGSSERKAPWPTDPNNGDLRVPHHLPWAKSAPFWWPLQPCRRHMMLGWNQCHLSRTACHLCRWKLPKLWEPQRTGPNWLQLDHWRCSILYLEGFRWQRCLERSKARLCQLGVLDRETTVPPEL